MITVHVSEPHALLSAIKTAISGGHIVTWQVDSDGDFTHATPQWNKKAWFRPVIDASAIRLIILGTKGVKMTRGTYAAYHGHFVEMLLNHFDTKFSRVDATALPTGGDRVGGV